MTGIRFRGPAVLVVPTRGRECSSAAPKTSLDFAAFDFLGKAGASYSLRSATTGETRVALRTGMYAAASVTRTRIVPASESVSGSASAT
jgi:hypothetical protein